MQTIYKWDDNRNYVGSEVVPDGVRYSRSTSIAPDESLINPKWMGTGGGWQESKKRQNYANITISTDKSVYNVGEIISTEVNTSIPISGTYFVPVIRRSDGEQVEFLELTLSFGRGYASFSLSKKGVYIIEADEIEPKPKMTNITSPKIIVK